MTQPRFSLKGIAACGIVTALLLAGCGDDPAKLIASARDAVAKRDFNTATIQIKNALQKDPKNADARILFGQLLLEQGDPANAEKEFRKVLEADAVAEAPVPLIAKAMVEAGRAKELVAEFGERTLSTAAAKSDLASTLGLAYLALGEVEKASDSYALAVKEAPDFGPALLGQALVAAARQDMAGASKRVDEVLAKTPQLIDALLLKADLKAADGKLEEAVEAAASVAKAGPSVSQAIKAQIRLISFHIRLAKLDAAAADLAALKQSAPKSLQTYFWEARLMLARNEPAKARDAIAQVLKGAPDHIPSVLLGSIAYMRVGNQLQAQALLEGALTKTKEQDEARKLLAESYLASRNPAKALEVLKPLLTTDAKDGAVFALAGQAYLLAGDAQKSTDFYAKQVAADPNNALARTRLGISRLAAQDDAHAMADLETAIRLNPNDVQADAAIIQALLRKGETQKAQEIADKLAQRQDSNPVAHSIRGGVLLAAKDATGARKAFERALELQPGNISAATQLARLDIIDKKPELARQRFEIILAKEPKNAAAYLLLAQLMLDTGGSQADARSLLEKGVAADATKLELRLALIRVLLQAGDSKSALEQAQQAQAASPDDPEVLRLLGGTQLATKQAQQAVTTFAKLQTLQPTNPANWIELAQAQSLANDGAAAEQSLRKAIQNNPDYPLAYERLVGLLVDAKRIDDALTVAKQMQSAQPENLVGYRLEAQVLGSAQRWPEAVAAWRKTGQKFKSPPVVIGIFEALLKQNKGDEAAKEASNWIKANPKDVVVRGYLAERAITAKDYREAQSQYLLILAVTPDSPAVLNNLAWVMHQLKDPKALSRAEAAVKLAPKSPAILETLGTILVDRGETARGLEALQQAVVLAANAPDLHLSYARALGKTGDKTGAQREANKALELAQPGSAERSEAEAFIKSL